MGILRKNQKEILESKNTDLKWKMPLIILLIDWTQVEERISELEDIILKSLQTQKQRE